MVIAILFVLSSIRLAVTSGQATVAACPSSCYCDDTWIYVNCVGDGLWEVPPDIPASVSRLELRNYAIGTLSANHVGQLSNLTELKLQQTLIERVDNGTFDGLGRLVRLDLSQNSLENLTHATFAGLTNLRYLDLSSNQLTQVGDAFHDLVNVEQLNLRDNKLKHLTAETFTGLQRVQYLNLDSNDIATIDVGTFQSLTHLVHLILSNNPLANLTRLDFFSARLLYIDVSHVGLLRVPQSLTQMVRDLRLAKNNLTHIRRGDFDSYPHLGLLVLDDNQITEIESDALGRQESLLRLWINGNFLRKVPANLPPTLRTLYIEENLLDTLGPYTFQGLTNVEQLFLQRNRLKDLSRCAFCDLVSLRSLDLQSNQIEVLAEGLFANLSKLETLELSQNPLRQLAPLCFVGVENLHVLRISRTKSTPQFDGSSFDALKKLEVLELYDSPGFVQQVLNSTRALHGLRNVRELNIMHNNVAALRQDFPHFFPTLREIKMSGNMWHCNQSILWMSQWIKRSDIQFYRSYSIRCASPQELQNRPVMTLTEADFPAPLTTTVQTTKTTETTTATTTTTTTKLATRMTTTQLPTRMTTTKLATRVTPSTRLTTTIITTKTPTTRLPVETTTTTTTTTTTHTPTTTEGPTSTKSTPTTGEKVQIPKITKTVPAASTTDGIAPPEAQPTTLTQQVSTREITPTATPTIAPTASKNPHQPKFDGKPEDSSSTGITVHTSEVKDNTDDEQTVIVVITSLAAGVLLVVIGSAAALVAYRCHQGSGGMRSGSGSGGCPVVRRSGSISYSPQRDEVSFVTVSEGTVGLKTATHHGLGNKLYFVMENGNGNVTKDALPETDLHELLPPPDEDGYYPYGTT